MSIEPVVMVGQPEPQVIDGYVCAECSAHRQQCDWVQGHMKISSAIRADWYTGLGVGSADDARNLILQDVDRRPNKTAIRPYTWLRPSRCCYDRSIRNRKIEGDGGRSQRYLKGICDGRRTLNCGHSKIAAMTMYPTPADFCRRADHF